MTSNEMGPSISEIDLASPPVTARWTTALDILVDLLGAARGLVLLERQEGGLLIVNFTWTEAAPLGGGTRGDERDADSAETFALTRRGRSKACHTAKCSLQAMPRPATVERVKNKTPASLARPSVAHHGWLPAGNRRYGPAGHGQEARA